MFATSLAIALFVSTPVDLSKAARNIARPVAAWAGGDTERRYQLELYGNEQCVLRLSSLGLATDTAIACRWRPSPEGIAVYRRSPLSVWPHASDARVGDFRVLEDGQAIQWIDDPTLTLHRVR